MLSSLGDRVVGKAGRCRRTQAIVRRRRRFGTGTSRVAYEEKQMKGTFYAGVAAAALLVGFAAPSHAMLILKVSDGTTTDTITDLSNSGAAMFNGAIGAFSFNVVT